VYVCMCACVHVCVVCNGATYVLYMYVHRALTFKNFRQGRPGSPALVGPCLGLWRCYYGSCHGALFDIYA
jgi:hypothetical protein